MYLPEIIDLGLRKYQEVLALQTSSFEEALSHKKEGKAVKNRVFLCEHESVYTLGKNGDVNNLLLSEAMLGADLVRINRGGDITFHGPGQLVVYPIIDLEYYGIGIAKYIWILEETVIRVLRKYYQIEAERLEGASGVWLDVAIKAKCRKICAIGVKASRYVSMHGLAFNMDTDLSWFQKIIPCGLSAYGVTRLSNETTQNVSMNELKTQFCEQFMALLTQTE